MIEKLPKLDSYIPTKADMSFCPLCGKKWVIYGERGKSGNGYFVCVDCEISIWIRDPLLGRWSRIEPEPCPLCKTPMKTFFRSDGYVKTQCPKCKFKAETVDPDKHDKLMADEERRGVRFTPRQPPKTEDV